MPKRTDLKKILVIGSGPIVIGQACEFDYSGTQAVKALKEEGYHVSLINSNPATIMTDPILADSTYIEPLTVEMLTKVIEKERPDAILPTMGGQTALNLAMDAHRDGVLEAFKVELIGARVDSIEKAENREKFKAAMQKIGIPVPKSAYVRSRDEAMSAIDEVGLPAILRPSYTLGGSGTSVAYNRDEYEKLIRWGLDQSPVHEVLVEESILGWKEYELEMMRDKNDNVVVICSIENLDPVGVHTGDSITIAPSQTLTDLEYQKLRDYSIAIMREIGVDSGGSNIQFAVCPDTGRVNVIEMNPRVSRSSALASKATGYPIAKFAARLAVGYTLDEIINDITRVSKASFEPTIDYVVTKIPRFTFAKFRGADRSLTTQMKSVGEVMAIGRTMRESLQKAMRSLEIDQYGFLGSLDRLMKDEVDHQALLSRIRTPRPERLLLIGEAFRRGISIDQLYEATKIDRWFLHHIEKIIRMEGEIATFAGKERTKNLLLRWKQNGFSDVRLAELLGLREDEVRLECENFGIKPVYKTVDTCAAEFESYTNYLYSTYEDEDESPPTDQKKIVILGSGPNRIGQGIEFDYCCVRASLSFREMGIESIMVNCNPETVSTDYDVSDRLYFEPLTEEDVLHILKRENPLGVILQFGGQTPLKLAHAIEKNGFKIMGTSPDSIDTAEDRDKFRKLLDQIHVRQPESEIAFSKVEAHRVAEKLGFPLVVRPSYVLGGRSMEIVYKESDLRSYLNDAVKASPEHPVLIDRYLSGSIELDVDAVSDGTNTFVAGIMEHVEQAGVHSGDSSCVLPPFSISEEKIKEIQATTKQIAAALGVRGLLNIQYALKDDQLYVIEVNPRASRTVPFVSKAIGIPLVHEAVRVILGSPLNVDFLESRRIQRRYCVKSPVFPFLKFDGVDTILGPEMKSTGEVMGMDIHWEIAYGKAQIAAGNILPHSGTLFLSVKDEDKEVAVQIAQDMRENGYRIVATRGTAQHLRSHGIPAQMVNKVQEGRPHIVDMILDEKIDLVMNTTLGKQSIKDSYSIRRSTLEKGISYFTTIEGSRAAAKAIHAFKAGKVQVTSLQEVHGEK